MTTPVYNEAAVRLQALRVRIIGELWDHPTYRALIDDLKARRPVVPYWKPAHVKNGILVPDNTADMQAASAQQKWHDVMMAIIDPQQKYENQPSPKGKDE
jgi:hypothetical protein